MQLNIQKLMEVTKEGESWRQVENYPYLISNLGRLYGIAHNKIDGGEWTAKGYHRYKLCKGGITSPPVRASHLVAAAFIKCYDPAKHTHIHHINRDRGDDRLINLLPVTEEQHRAIHALYDTLGDNIELLLELLTPIIEPIREHLYKGGDVA